MGLNKPRYQLGDEVVVKTSSLIAIREFTVEGVMRIRITPDRMDYYYKPSQKPNAFDWHSEDDICTPAEYIAFAETKVVVYKEKQARKR